jgi:hypothetical protein
MAYDAAGYYTLLFGGGNGGLLVPRIRYNDTWEWGNGWHQVFPATSPSARVGAGTAYDPTTGTIVLFGGQDINGNYLNDTWIWDGVTWTQQFPAVSPPSRELDEQSMAYDALTGTVVLFGGGNSSGGFADTWLWSGGAKTWTQMFPPTSPSPRAAPLTYDPVTKEIVLFGGGPDNLNDTWTWNGSPGRNSFRRRALRPEDSPPSHTIRALAKSYYSAGPKVRPRPLTTRGPGVELRGPI